MEFLTGNLTPPSVNGMLSHNVHGYDVERTNIEHARRQEDIAKALAQTIAMSAALDAERSKVVSLDTARQRVEAIEPIVDLPLASGH